MTYRQSILDDNNVLPKYTQVEYLKGVRFSAESGTYIDTGYEPTGSTSIEVVFKADSFMNDVFVTGVYKNVTDNKIWRIGMYSAYDSQHYIAQQAVKTISPLEQKPPEWCTARVDNILSIWNDVDNRVQPILLFC